MRLSRKHQNQQPVVFADFSGGLNTSTSIESIAKNQLAECVNCEADHSTGRLKTVAGTIDILQADNIFAAIYDEINNAVLIVKTDKSVHLYDANLMFVKSLGNLTGTLFPISCPWENGVIISSGDKLQYYDGTNLTTLTDSPICSAVYIRAGRVVAVTDTELRYSAVGDETSWTEDTGDNSSAKYLEIGYKDGGKILGAVNLYSDILIIKNNRRVYRLSGEFPNWQLTEVTRNIECGGRLSFCDIADAVFVLGRNEAQMIRTTDAFGDMKPSNVASQVAREINLLPGNALVRFVPPLQQIWCIGAKGLVMIYDLAFNSWYKRQFNSEVIDVISVGNAVFVVKPDRIARLDEKTFYDSEKPLQWRFTAQRLVSQHDYLLKRTQISVMPVMSDLYTGSISAGAVIVPFPIPSQSISIYENKSTIVNNHVAIDTSERQRYLYSKDDTIYENVESIYENDRSIFSRQSYIKESRNIYRNKFIDIRGSGEGGGFILSGIILDLVEV